MRPKVAQPPVFGSCLLSPNGWMDEDVTLYGSRPLPSTHCVRRAPSCPPPRKWHTSPLFSAHVYCGHGRSSQLLLSSCYVCGSRVVVVVVAVVVVVVVVVVFLVVVVVVQSATKFKYVSNRSKLCKGMTLVECCYHGLNQ